MVEKQNIFFPEIADGLHAGALKAIESARQFGTKLVVWYDGRMIEMTPDEAEAMMKKRAQTEEIEV